MTGGPVDKVDPVVQWTPTRPPVRRRPRKQRPSTLIAEAVTALLCFGFLYGLWWAHRPAGPSPPPLAASTDSCYGYVRVLTLVGGPLLVSAAEIRIDSVTAASYLVDAVTALQDARSRELDPLVRAQEDRLTADVRTLVNDEQANNVAKFIADEQTLDSAVSTFSLDTAGCGVAVANPVVSPASRLPAPGAAPSCQNYDKVLAGVATGLLASSEKVGIDYRAAASDLALAAGPLQATLSSEGNPILNAQESTLKGDIVNMVADEQAHEIDQLNLDEQKTKSDVSTFNISAAGC